MKINNTIKHLKRPEFSGLFLFKKPKFIFSENHYNYVS